MPTTDAPESKLYAVPKTILNLSVIISSSIQSFRALIVRAASGLRKWKAIAFPAPLYDKNLACTSHIWELSHRS